MALPELETHLDEKALRELVATGGWTRDGATLTKTFRAKNFVDAVAFVDRIAPEAEKLNHHPDVHIESYKNVRIELSTHATKKLSDADVALARRIDAVFPAS